MLRLTPTKNLHLLESSWSAIPALIASGKADVADQNGAIPCNVSPCQVINVVAGTQDISAQQLIIKGTAQLGTNSGSGRSVAGVVAASDQTIDVLQGISLLGGDKSVSRSNNSTRIQNFSGVQDVTAESLH